MTNDNSDNDNDAGRRMTIGQNVARGVLPNNVLIASICVQSPKRIRGAEVFECSLAAKRRREGS